MSNHGTILYRIDQHTNKTDTCWLWTGDIDDWGYARITVGTLRIRVHRYIWEKANGPIPEGMKVLHKCDITYCIRLEHLFLGTPQANVNDMILKGRKASTRGSNNPRTHLNEFDIVQIRAQVASGCKQVDVAKEYQLSTSALNHIITRRSWAHVS